MRIVVMDPSEESSFRERVQPLEERLIHGVGRSLHEEPKEVCSFYVAYDRRRIAWFSPDPRGILPLDGLHVSRSLRRSLRRYDIRFDTAFRAVMEACGDPSRQAGWITRDFVDATLNPAADQETSP